MNTVCPGCGLSLSSSTDSPDPKIHASAECRKLCHELSLYTLMRGDVFFIHQVAVDAYAAQHYKEGGPVIGLAFALVGLCLLLEYNRTGKEVQDAHMRLAQKNKKWPLFRMPVKRGDVTVADPLAAAPGDERDAMIKKWAASVWEAYADVHDEVRTLLNQYGEI